MIFSRRFPYSALALLLLSGRADATIVGGSVVQKDDPVSRSTVALKFAGGRTCSGTLVSPHVVLSAAHCARNPGGATVFFGLAPGDPNVRMHRATVVLEHPDYRREAAQEDLALFGFDGEAPKSFQVAELAPADYEFSDDSTLIIAGFGSDSYHSNSPTEQIGTLKKAVVPFAYPMDLPGELHTWLSDRGEGFSYGDSGGPGYIDRDGQLVLLGVISRMTFLKSGVLPNYQSLSDVRTHRQWIASEASAMEELIEARRNAALERKANRKGPLARVLRWLKRQGR
jgi:hypothetical protein